MSITPQDIGSFFLTLVVPVTTGIAAAWFTAKFALSRFYHEKWWEKKHAAYNQVLDNLFELKDLYGQASASLEQDWHAQDGVSEPSERTVDWDKYHQLKARVHRIYVLAPISLSDCTRALLKDYFDKEKESERQVVEDGEQEFIAYDKMSGTVQKIIDAIVRDAEVELKFK